MEFTAQMIASFLGGVVEGDKEIKVSTVAKIEEGEPGTLSFLSNPKYEEFIYSTKASVVIVANSFEAKEPISATLIRVEDAYGAFAKLLELYQASKPTKKGVSPKASISQSATMGENLYVGDFVVIEEGVTVGDGSKIYPQSYIGDNVYIGSNVTIYAGVKIYEQTIIGDGVIIHSGAVIGADGFGFAPNADGSFSKIPQIGNVVIEDNVEIGANTCVDRATMGSTVIKRGVKLDNLIQLGHNTTIGENTVIASQTGIAGSTKIGKNVMMGGQVGVAGHISIADGVKVGSQSGISNNVKTEGEAIMGYPAIGAMMFQRASIVFKDLPALRTKIFAIVKDIEELKKGQL